MQVMQKMILVEAHVKWSVILMDLLGPDIFSRYEWKNKFCIVSERIWKFQVSQWFENELLTKKLLMVFSRLNHVFAFFRLFSADHSFEERLVKFGKIWCYDWI